MELRSILVATDFAPGSLPALAEALRISRWGNTPLRAVHVIDPLVLDDLCEALPHLAAELHASVIQDAQNAWQRLASSLPGLESVPLEVRVGSPARTIAQYARETESGLLVMGVRGHRPGAGAGTVAAGVVRAAAVPTLLVRERQDGPFRLVVACTDFSAGSLLALDYAARIATQDEAALHVLHTFEPPWRHLHYRAPTPEADPQFRTQYQQVLQRRLESFGSRLGRPLEYLKPVYVLFDAGDHRSGISAYAQQVNADLVVLGTLGRRSIRDALLGSTAEKVLTECPSSLLAVPAA